MYKVFINDKALILISSKEISMLDNSQNIEHYSCPSCMNRAIAKLANTQLDTLILAAEDINRMWLDFQSRYELIDAAGGVLINEKGESLWIKRNGMWDLPKGKVEPNEETPTAAVREVEEECSVDNICLGELLGITFHTYSLNNKNILKSTYWYAMKVEGNQLLQPQLEEGITDVQWIAASEVQALSKESYTSITELLRQEKVKHHLGF